MNAIEMDPSLEQRGSASVPMSLLMGTGCFLGFVCEGDLIDAKWCTPVKIMDMR